MTPQVHHENTGRCLKCLEIINRYPGFDPELKVWFVFFQEKNPTFHVSCAGRGMVEQEAAFQRGASKAHYGESAHNFGAALDLFILANGVATWPTLYKEITGAGGVTKRIVDRIATASLPEWRALRKALSANMVWFGEPSAEFWELPHVQRKDWKLALVRGELTKVA